MKRLTLLGLIIIGGIGVMSMFAQYTPSDDLLDGAMRYVNARKITPECKSAIILVDVAKGELMCPYVATKRACRKAWNELVNVRYVDDNNEEKRLLDNLAFNADSKDKQGMQDTFDQRIEFLQMNNLPLPYTSFDLQEGEAKYSVRTPEGWRVEQRKYLDPDIGDVVFEDILVSKDDGSQADIIWIDGVPEAHVPLKAEEWRDADGSNVGTSWQLWNR